MHRPPLGIIILPLSITICTEPESGDDIGVPFFCAILAGKGGEKMKRKKNPQGTMVMFLETDLEKSLSFDENSFTPLQKQYYTKLSATEQEKIRAG